ncbi:MAG: methionyl-tRNA formyltransferase [Tepidisphaerales bacterium]
MDVLFAGSGEFGLPTLAALLDAGHKIVHVYSQPDRPAGRGKHFTPTPISQFCLDKQIPLTRTEDVNIENFPAADLLVVIAFGQKLSERLAAHARLGSVNLHASLLPRWRGAAPINWAILSGDATTGNSVIRLAQRMDAGAILAQAQTPIAELETAGELHDRLAVAGAALMLDVIRELEAGRAVETSQDDARVTLARKLNRDSARLGFAQPADIVARQIRGLFPWPGCRVQLVDPRGQPRARLTLVRARPVDGAGEPGVVGPDGSVGCTAGGVEILEVLPDGKRIMPLAAFRNGHPWEPGMKLEGVA